MILDGERTGRLTHDRILLDATSGNTGIAYAMIGALKGYKVKLCLPANASHERKQILKGYGAEMVFSDPGEGSDGAIRLCRKSTKPIPTRIFIPINTTTPPTGRRISTAPRSRFWSRPAARITHFVACMGTSGTFMGNSRRLKRDVPGVHAFPRSPPPDSTAWKA